MTEPVSHGSARPLPIVTRPPARRLGYAVVDELVNLIVTGRVAPGDLLPPELPLSQQFGVSRTVVRESVKRLEEKGLVSVVQGRGTEVQPTSAWNMMDRVVLTSLIRHDDTLGILDELSVVRGRLEAVMAGETARTRTPAELEELRDILGEMEDSLDDRAQFDAADGRFHERVMAISGNRLAESIAKVLFDRARDSDRFHGKAITRRYRLITLKEHTAIFEAIEGGKPAESEEVMLAHIIDAWRRRRLPDHRGKQRRAAQARD